MKDLFEQVPSLLDLLHSKIEEHDMDCADNFRAAKVGDVESEEAYEEAASHGCCGRFDYVTTVDGVEYMIGCHYGH
jgi:hypothetical protein